MIIEKSQSTKLKFLDLVALDPITVFIEDIEPGKGKITIECYGKSWSYYWGGMGGHNVTKFFSTVSVDYIANCLWDHSKIQYEDDYSGIQKLVRERVLECRKDSLISKNSARTMYNIGNWEDYAPKHQYDEWSLPDDVTDDDFERISLNYESIPVKNTHEYNYLTRIVTVVKEALLIVLKETKDTK
jgi:hypothetical protein